MEVRTMFWTIAALLFVAIIVLVGITMSGSILQLQSCAEEDVYPALSPSLLPGADERGTYCGQVTRYDEQLTDLYERTLDGMGWPGDITGFLDETILDSSEPEVYCNWILITGEGFRKAYREKDGCVDKQKHLCCRNCYTATNRYDGVPCGYDTDASGGKHYYFCLAETYDAPGGYPSIDVCADHSTRRCCRNWAGFATDYDLSEYVLAELAKADIYELGEGLVHIAESEVEDIVVEEIEGVYNK